MGKLTRAKHAEQAQDLFCFYAERASELEERGQYFMAAIALSFALETAVLTCLLVGFGEENGGEPKIPDSFNMSELVSRANEIDVLNAPIDVPSHLSNVNSPPKYVAKDVVDKIRRFRNLIHPARSLKESHDPRTFTKEQFSEFQEMFDSVTHSLLYSLLRK
jgi:hypothetical protein